LGDLMRVLVVEDDGDIAALIQNSFRRQCAADVEVVGAGSAALSVVDADPPEVMILDLDFPGIDGFTVCRRLRS